MSTALGTAETPTVTRGDAIDVASSAPSACSFADARVAAGEWCTPAQYAGSGRAVRVGRDFEAARKSWPVGGTTGRPYAVSLDLSPQTPPEESLSAVTASLTVRYAVTTTIEEVSPGPLAAP